MHLLTGWLLANAEESRPASTRREGWVEVIVVRMASQTNLIFGLTGAWAIDVRREKHSSKQASSSAKVSEIGELGMGYQDKQTS